MKKLLALLLCLVLVLGLSSVAYASGLTITDGADALEEQSQFPFLAETDELAVNVRADASTKAQKVGRLERGTRVTVTGAALSSTGELWYAVELADGTQGYIRSDLLVEAELMEAERAAYQMRVSTAENAQDVLEDQLIGNRKTKKYHETWCRSLPAEKNQVFFSSADEAEDAGYVHCKNCD